MSIVRSVFNLLLLTGRMLGDGEEINLPASERANIQTNVGLVPVAIIVTYFFQNPGAVNQSTVYVAPSTGVIAQSRAIDTPSRDNLRPLMPLSPNSVSSSTLPKNSQLSPAPYATLGSAPQNAVRQPVKKPMDNGSFYEDVKQCVYYDSGAAYCFDGCTKKYHQYPADRISNSAVLKRDCLPDSLRKYGWLSEDGILLDWMTPEIIPPGEAPRILAVCSFDTDRTFSCLSSTRCFGSPETCAGVAGWSGKLSPDSSTAHGDVLKGAIDINSVKRGGGVRYSRSGVRLLPLPYADQPKQSLPRMKFSRNQ